MNTEEIFGSKTWEDLRRVLASYLWNRFYAISPDDVDDAVSEAMVDLLGYWIDLPSSVTEDTRRNWAFALWRAKHIGANRIHRLLTERGKIISFELPEEGEQTVLDLLANVPEPEPPTGDEERNERIREMLSSLDVEDLEKWLHPLLAGESQRAQARRQKIAQSSVCNLRAFGKKKLFAMAVDWGIYG